MKPPTILIVEDEAIIARDIRQQLGELGYEPIGETATGEGAIALTDQLKPDLVLMDIHLAGKLDGIEAAAVIRKQFGTPVVFLTAFAGAETLERAKVTEPFGYIIKPFDERYLHTIIEMALYKHRAESHLKRAHDEQATILRTALDGFFMADWQGRLLEVNESSCAMLGYSRDELLTMSLADLDILPEKSQPVVGLEALKQPKPARFERAQRRKDGGAIFVEMSVNYLPHSGGRIFCFARDITERRAATDNLVRLNAELETRVTLRTQDLEEAKKEAEAANRAKAFFLATMTHELRTPLNGVIGTLDVLRQTTLESHQLEMLDLVDESAASLLAVVDDILDFSKIEAGRLGIDVQPMSIAAVVEKVCSVIAPMTEKTEVELTLFADPGLPGVVLGDGVRLKQVLLNLANNAIKFSSRQKNPGRVSIRALLAGQTANDVTVVFEVKDNGIGMNADTLALLFNSFTQGDASITRTFGGTGLGLAISRNLVEIMGGNLTVSSEAGQGSTFRARISFALKGDRPERVLEASELAGLSCLLIGDPDGLHDDLAAYLESAGATVDRSPDLESARQRAGATSTELRVWILTFDGDRPPIEPLTAAFEDIRFVLLARGRRRKPHPVAKGVVVVDAHLLTRGAFVRAVSCAAGWAAVESATTPLTIRRSPATPPSRDRAIERRQMVLVAEDNEVSQQVILRQLSLLGYAADVASGGREALGRWQTGVYSLLLADLHMPEMDGYQLAAAIRAQEVAPQHTIIIALTADVLKGAAQQCRDAGLDDSLYKPARLSEVKAMLGKWLPLHLPADPSSTHAASVEPTPGPPVNLAVLEEFVGRDPEVILEFLRAFFVSTAKTAAELETACERREAAVVAELAHKLKPLARAVGAIQLAILCDELEGTAKASDFDSMETCLPRFEAERVRVDEYLRQA